jgi:hypothetical protein
MTRNQIENRKGDGAGPSPGSASTGCSRRRTAPHAGNPQGTQQRNAMVRLEVIDGWFHRLAIGFAFRRGTWAATMDDRPPPGSGPDPRSGSRGRPRPVSEFGLRLPTESRFRFVQADRTDMAIVGIMTTLRRESSMGQRIV